ncbi:MAG: hypothetical protein KDD51_16080, partial [Bdellovibrionales bacterium]|nr:hypothetical protein [Bdellovibrionales bacterium]
MPIGYLPFLLAATLAVVGCHSDTFSQAQKTQFGAKRLIAADTTDSPGVYVRFKLVEPTQTVYYVRLHGIGHVSPYYLAPTIIPRTADTDASKRVPSESFTDWFDLKGHAGSLLHKQRFNTGGVAEFLNVIVKFVTASDSTKYTVVIELADQPDEAFVVKRFEETFNDENGKTSFLASPNLREDADRLETAAQMTARRLRWATAASGGQRRSPQQHIIQTHLWTPQRSDLNVEEVKVLDLLGINTVTGLAPEARAAFPNIKDAHASYSTQFGPARTRAEIDQNMRTLANSENLQESHGVPFNFSDEVTARPAIGEDVQARAHFHEWLSQNNINPSQLGVNSLSEVTPLDNYAAYEQAKARNPSAAARVFYYTMRFRQVAGAKRLRWNTESFHKYFPSGWKTSTLTAVQLNGTGLGTGTKEIMGWGGYHLALDWFDLVRKKAVDLFAVEDWLGLQYQYGPYYTWEGFQLLGFQTAQYRSAGNNQDVPIITWITPSDAKNLRLKAHSALAQGSKHFYFWSYGPTPMSTENYWSDLRSMYDGIVRVTRQLASAEEILYPAKHRPTRVALLYSISSDIWQPYDYRNLLDRRGIYLSLVHDQFQVDMITEEDVEAGRLANYKALYTTDPNIKRQAVDKIVKWVSEGGYVFASGNAGTKNEFNEPVSGLANVLGVRAGATAELQVAPAALVDVIDNDDADEFTTSGRWTSGQDSRGHRGSLVYAAAGNGQTNATWTFTDLSPNTYQVSATWFPHSNRATNAPFTIRDGVNGPVLATTFINQQKAPDDFSDRGSQWENLKSVTITGKVLVVELANNADGFVIADAIRIQGHVPSYRYRAGLNGIPHLDRIAIDDEHKESLGPGFGVIGLRTDLQENGGTVVGRFGENLPAVVSHTFGKG